MNCSMLGCEEVAIVIFERVPIRLHWGEELHVDMAFCLDCEDAYINEPWRDNLWPAGLPADPPARRTSDQKKAAPRRGRPDRDA